MKWITTVISGSFVRFGFRSRDAQCMANSVVFLAFAFVIQDKWTSADVDAILTLGDQIYRFPYPEAIKVRPRTEHEILRDSCSEKMKQFDFV